MKKFFIVCFAVLFCGLSSCTKTATAPSASGVAVSGAVSGAISGKIVLAPALARFPIQPTAAIYLIARVSGESAGPPVAVKRFMPPFQFPIEFTLSSQDKMMPDVPFQGPFAITVRLAQSGSATPAAQGDFEGSAGGAVQIGAQGVELPLAHVRN